MSKRPKALWRPMTPLEAQIADSIAGLRYPIASPPKRLARNLHQQSREAEPRITDRQAAAMWKQAWTFRRQIHDRAIFAKVLSMKAEMDRRGDTAAYQGGDDGKPGTDGDGQHKPPGPPIISGQASPSSCNA